MILERLGPSIKSVKDDHPFVTRSDALKVGIQMIEGINKIHDAGYLHCDIKIDNILTAVNWKVDPQLTFINFGQAVKYLLPDGSHRPNVKLPKSDQNLYFSSTNWLKNETPDRRDDIFSIAYSIIFFLNRFLPFKRLNENLSTS